MSSKSILRKDLWSLFSTRTEWPGPGYLLRLTKLRRLQTVTGELTATVAANSPIVPGLANAALDTRDGRLEALFLAMRDDLVSGMRLSEAMRKRPRFFPRAYADQVEAGEQSGRLQEVLSGLSESLTHSANFCSVTYAVWAYLTFLFAAQVVVVSFLLTYIIPNLAACLVDLGSTAPRVARLVLNNSSRYLWTGGAVVLISVCWALWNAWRNWHAPPQRRWFRMGILDHVLFHVPLVGAIGMKQDLAHAMAVLARLLDAGVPLDEALDSASTLDISAVYAATIRRWRDRIRQGQRLAETVEAEKWYFPESFHALIAIGEDSARLPETMQHLAETYRREARKATRILYDTVFPVGIVGLGCVNLVIALTVFQLLTRMMTILADAV